MRVNEIFYSLQGEGVYMGYPTVFIRFYGCDKDCSFCDSKAATTSHFYAILKPEEIVAQVENEIGEYARPFFVVLTGGEPTIQNAEEIRLLTVLLHEKEFDVHLETHGDNPIPKNWLINHITASPKDFEFSSDCGADELKFVITKDTIEEEFVGRLNALFETMTNTTGIIWLQPDGYYMQESWEKAYKIAMHNPTIRVGVQLHKLMNIR
jgi:organic radical activating enzyme